MNDYALDLSNVLAAIGLCLVGIAVVKYARRQLGERRARRDFVRVHPHALRVVQRESCHVPPRLPLRTLGDRFWSIVLGVPDRPAYPPRAPRFAPPPHPRHRSNVRLIREGDAS